MCGKEIVEKDIFRKLLSGKRTDTVDCWLAGELRLYGPTNRKFDLCYECYEEILKWLAGEQIKED
jgi:hypothetical protein